MTSTIFEEDINNIIKEELPWDTLSTKTFLVTGANGFISYYVVRVLLALKNVKVIAMVRNKQKAESRFKDIIDNSNFKIVVQDLNEPFTLDDKIDYVIHGASQASPKYYGIDPVGTLKTNCIGTSYLLDIAVKNNVKKFLFISSGEVYGKVDETTPELVENYNGNLNITDIRSCYGESKRMGENMCVCYSHQYGINVNMLRLSHIYGWGFDLDDGRVIPDFVSNIIKNEDIVLNSDGSAKRSFCYITDMILALFYVLFYGEDKNAYNIASETETSIIELAKMMVEFSPNSTVKHKEGVFQKGYIRAASTRAKFNIDKIKSLGWQEKVALKDGLKRMVECYKSCACREIQ